MPDAARCSVEGCKRPVRAKGMCATHYQRSRRGPKGRDVSLPVRQPATGDMRRLVLYVDADVEKRIHNTAADEGISTSAAAVRALERGLAKK